MARSPHAVADLIGRELRGAILVGNGGRARRCVAAAMRADRTGRARGAAERCINVAAAFIGSGFWGAGIAEDAMVDLGE